MPPTRKQPPEVKTFRGPIPKRGFTLIEVLLAIALIGIFGGLAVIQFPRMLDSLREPDPESSVIGALREVRIEALRQSEAIRVRLKVDSDTETAALTGESVSGAIPPIPLPSSITELQFLPDPAFDSNPRKPDPSPVGEISPTGRYGFGGFTLQTTSAPTLIEITINPMSGAPDVPSRN